MGTDSAWPKLIIVGTQTVNKRVNCGRLSDVRGLCQSQSAMPFPSTKTMPGLKGHALSEYKDYAWLKKSSPFPAHHPETNVLNKEY